MIDDLFRHNILKSKNDKIVVNINYKRIIRSKLPETLVHLGSDSNKWMEQIYLLFHKLKNVPKCKRCDNSVVFINFGTGYRSTCSDMCRAKTNSFLGKRHTIETKQKMSKNHADFSGDNNPFRNRCNSDPQFRSEFKLTHLNLWKTRNQEWRLRFSETLSRAMKISTIHKLHLNKKYKSGMYFSTKLKDHSTHYRSSWEFSLMCYLDQCELVDSYEYESVKLEYMLNDYTYRHTIPDFLIKFTNGRILMIEVKPDKMAELQSMKIDGQQGYCMENLIQYLHMGNIYFKEYWRIREALQLGYDGKLSAERFVEFDYIKREVA